MFYKYHLEIIFDVVENNADLSLKLFLRNLAQNL